MEIKKFDLNQISRSFTQSWSPCDIETIGNFVLRAAKFDGPYHWHKHDNADEMFIVFEGKIIIQTRKGNFVLETGEGIKIPRGVEHCPVVTVRSMVMMFEQSGLESKGD